MLEGRRILLTGASSGIGATTASLLGSMGADVIAHHRSQDDLPGARAAVSDIDESRRLLLAADFADDASVDRMWDEAVAWKGSVNVLVQNAAMMSAFGGVDDNDQVWAQSWSEHMQVNVQAPARLMRAAVRHFREQGGGVIIVMSSWVAQRGGSNSSMLPYAASKAAIKAVAQSIARAYSADNILTYIIAPGIVDTKMSRDFAKLQGGEDAVTQSLAMHEWVPPEDLGNLIAFLAGGTVRHLSGATLDVNGASYIR